MTELAEDLLSKHLKGFQNYLKGYLSWTLPWTKVYFWPVLLTPLPDPEHEPCHLYRFPVVR